MFEGGAIELVHDFMRRSNVAMSLRLEQTDLAPLSANERIATAVRFRLEHLAPYVRSWPQAMAMGLLPHNVGATASILAEMSDEMWWHAGDRSTDLNWYTRRCVRCMDVPDGAAGFAQTCFLLLAALRVHLPAVVRTP
jgi:ubiquinone biosynthesis protein COQ9